VQRWLRDLGSALGFDVYVAANDRGRPVDGGRLGDGCRDDLPSALAAAGADSVRLIDVIWLERNSDRVAGAFEVEHTTSIYSGIVRLLDLALGAAEGAAHGLFLVAPDSREADVRAQLRRPAFQGIARLQVRFLPYSELERHREAMARFGAGLKAIEAVARTLT
jgi:type II restriction enzyme